MCLDLELAAGISEYFSEYSESCCLLILSAYYVSIIFFLVCFLSSLNLSNHYLGTGAVSRAPPTELTQREPQVADRRGPLVGEFSGYNKESLVDHSG